MDYSQLSDFEINKRVAKSIYSVSFVEPLSRTVSVSGGKRLFDPCNNPADAWPIIAGSKINIEWHEWKGGEFKPYALNNETMKSCYDDNPLRAAMIVFLMMQDANHA